VECHVALKKLNVKKVCKKRRIVNEKYYPSIFPKGPMKTQTPVRIASLTAKNQNLEPPEYEAKILITQP
jgi:hypothetical protein